MSSYSLTHRLLSFPLELWQDFQTLGGRLSLTFADQLGLLISRSVRSIQWFRCRPSQRLTQSNCRVSGQLLEGYQSERAIPIHSRCVSPLLKHTKPRWKVYSIKSSTMNLVNVSMTLFTSKQVVPTNVHLMVVWTWLPLTSAKSKSMCLCVFASLIWNRVCACAKRGSIVHGVCLLIFVYTWLYESNTTTTNECRVHQCIYSNGEKSRLTPRMKFSMTSLAKSCESSAT